MTEDKAIVSYRTIQKPNGGLKTEKLYSYAVLLTAPGPEHVVHSMRLDGYANKYDAMKVIWDQFPGLKVKAILKLYESEFAEEEVTK